jgi:hypothetical protein
MTKDSIEYLPVYVNGWYKMPIFIGLLAKQKTNPK